jgi:DNA topoisomerase II
MDDDSLMDSVFEEGESSDFAPTKPSKPAKAAKPNAAAPKKAAGPAKPRGRRPKDTAQAKPKAKAAPKKKPKDDSDNENSDLDMNEDPYGDDESLLADTPPKQKKAPGPKKTSGKPLADIANESFGMDGSDDPIASAKKTAGGASSRYQMVALPETSDRARFC